MKDQLLIAKFMGPKPPLYVMGGLATNPNSRIEKEFSNHFVETYVKDTSSLQVIRNTHYIML